MLILVKDRKLSLDRLAQAFVDAEADSGANNEPVHSVFVVLDDSADGASDVFRQQGLAAATRGQLTALLNAAQSAPDPPFSLDGLTERDRDVMKLLVDGLSNKEIGYQLAIPEPTVKRSVQRIFARCGVRTRAQVVRAVLENRFRPEDLQQSTATHG